MITRTQGKGAKGDSGGMKISRHPDSINRRLPFPVALLECDWGEEGGVCSKNRFLESYVGSKRGDLFFPDVMIHVSHEDNVVSCCLPG